MRLCLNDSGIGAPYRNVTRERLQRIKDIGFRVIGVNPDVNATEDDFRYLNDLLGEMEMYPGPGSAGCAPFHPDPAEAREWKKQIIERIRAASKVGIPNLRMSGGSMDPDNRWLHHPENHTQKALDLYVEHTLEVKSAAEDYGVMLTPETTNFTIIDTVQRMREFVDRCDSPYIKVVFDFVNHMTAHTVYQNARFSRCAVAVLGDRIGVFHVKDVMLDPKKLLVSHIDEAPMGTGLLDHAAVMEASKQLEPWKTFSLEHFNDPDMDTYDEWVRAYRHINGVAKKSGFVWTEPACTRDVYESGRYKD